MSLLLLLRSNAAPPPAGQTVTQTARFDNAQAFFAATVTATRNVTAARFDNAQTFFAATVATSNAVTVARYDNAQTFYPASVTAIATIAQGTRFGNEQTFFGGSVQVAGQAHNVLEVDRFNNESAFFSADVHSSSVEVKRKGSAARRSQRFIILPEAYLVDGEIKELTPAQAKKAAKRKKRVLKIEPDSFTEIQSTEANNLAAISEKPSKRRNDDEYAILLMI